MSDRTPVASRGPAARAARPVTEARGPHGRLPVRRTTVAFVGGALAIAVVTLGLLSTVGGVLGPAAFLLPALVAAGAIAVTAPADRAFGLVCFFVAALPLGSFGVGPLQVVQLTAVLAVGGVLAIETSRGDLTPVPWPIGLPLAAMVVSAAISSYGTPQPDVTFRLDVALVISVLLVSVVHSVTVSASRLRTLARLVVAAAAVVSLLSLRSAGEAEVSNAGAVVTGRAVGIFSQPNELGIFCAMLLPVAVALALAEPSRRARVLTTLGAGAITAGLVVSLSRGAWTGAVVGLLALWIFSADRRRFLVPVVTSVAATLATAVVLADRAIVAIINQRVASLFGGAVNPYDERPAIYAEARRQITDSPWVGHGPGAFPYVGQQLNQDGYYLQAAHAHNLLLNTWAEYGLVGVTCLVALIVGLVSQILPAYRAVRARLDDADALLCSRLVAGATAGLVAVLAHGVVDYPFRNPVTSTTLWLLVGLLAAATRVALTYAPTTGPVAGARRAAPGPPEPAEPPDPTDRRARSRARGALS